MKYTAAAIILIGLVIAGFAGVQYATSDVHLAVQQGHVEPASSSGPLLLLGYAALVMALGAVIWIFGGRGFTVGRFHFGRRRFIQSEKVPVAK